MNENPEVTAWLDELEHPLLSVILAVRAVILEADDRITETIKWKSPTFMYESNLASIDPKAKKHVAVLFHRGAEIPRRASAPAGRGQAGPLRAVRRHGIGRGGARRPRRHRSRLVRRKGLTHGAALSRR